MTEQLAREVREFWLDPGRRILSPQEDSQIVRERFGALLDQAAAGELNAWTNSPRRALSLIIVLDQFSRVIHQSSAQAYAYDEQALATALGGIERGADAALTLTERLFFYMPMQRSELLSIQEDGLAIYERLAAEASAAELPLADAAARAARDSHDVITRFGRFPRRNKALGRATTPAEEEWLSHRFGPAQA